MAYLKKKNPNPFLYWNTMQFSKVRRIATYCYGEIPITPCSVKNKQGVEQSTIFLSKNEA